MESEIKKEKKKRIALVHDFLLYYGGAEATLKSISEIFSEDQGNYQSEIFTILKNKKIAREIFPNQKVYSSFLQKWPKFIRKRHKLMTPFMPVAVETFDFRDYDMVISSSSAFAKGMVVKPKTTHVCYMHAPMRYVWDWHHEYIEENKLKGEVKFFTRLLLNYLRMWDRASADRVDHFIANSKYTQKRIKKYYRKDSTVIYPPVDVSKFTPQKENMGYFLAVGRLSPYKSMKLLVDVFDKLKLPLVIVGDGEERKELEKMVEGNKHIRIMGWVEDEKLAKLYENARAFVSVSLDDFQITTVEAMAAGKPAIVLKKGGTAETVVEGVTGEFFDVAQLEIVADGIRRFIEKDERGVYDYKKIRERAEEFSKARFEKEMREFIEGIKN